MDTELNKAIQAMEVLDKWFSPKLGSKNKIVCTTRKSKAAAFGLTIDTLRTWERIERAKKNHHTSSKA